MRLNSLPLDEAALRKPTLNLGRAYTEKQAMALAVELAWKGLGKTSPNPMVGAVALDENGCLLGTGFHSMIGGPHAEVDMWTDIQRRHPELRDLTGAKVFVSLEPCAHHGKTPPCAELLVRLRPRSVNYLMEDPNPKVAGSGAQFIRDAGIEAICWNDPESLGQIQNEIFLWRQKNQGKIFVGMKVAATLGGAIASLGDQRRWLTSERARRFGHFLRLRYDAIAVGANTVILDNPKLDAEGFGDLSRAPFKLVIDPQLRAARHYFGLDLLPNVAKSAPDQVLWFCHQDADIDPAATWLARAGVKIIHQLQSTSVSSPEEILGPLQSFPIFSLLLEGGAGLYGAFLDQGRVQRLHEFIAPKFIGNPSGTLAIEAGRRRSEELELTGTQLSILGCDLLIESWFKG